jgi:hypothetical protein
MIAIAVVTFVSIQFAQNISQLLLISHGPDGVVPILTGYAIVILLLAARSVSAMGATTIIAHELTQLSRCWARRLRSR